MDTIIDNTQDTLDVRDVIERLEELEARQSSSDGCDRQELDGLKSLLGELAGGGDGDEQWRGDWYPLTLIRDTYFHQYTKDLAYELDLVNPEAAWPGNCIDWDRAARELQVDYSSVDYGGVTYWYR